MHIPWLKVKNHVAANGLAKNQYKYILKQELYLYKLSDVYSAIQPLFYEITTAFVEHPLPFSAIFRPLENELCTLAQLPPHLLL